MDIEKYETIVGDIVKEQAIQSEKIKAALLRIDEQTKIIESLRDIASSVKILAVEQQQTTERLQLLTKEVSAIKDKPAKRWDTIIVGIITAIVSSGVAFILAK